MDVVVLVLILVRPSLLLDRSVGAHSVYVFGPGWVGRRTLSAEELARDVELLAADNNNLLAVQKLLGDSGGQSSEKMSFSIDDNLAKISAAPKDPPFMYPFLRVLHSCVLQVGRVRAKIIRGRGCVPQARRWTFSLYG